MIKRKKKKKKKNNARTVLSPGPVKEFEQFEAHVWVFDDKGKVSSFDHIVDVTAIENIFI